MYSYYSPKQIHDKDWLHTCSSVELHVEMDGQWLTDVGKSAAYVKGMFHNGLQLFLSLIYIYVVLHKI